MIRIFTAFLFAIPVLCAAVDVPQWHRFEATFESPASYQNPMRDVELHVEFTSPSGKKTTVPGFWDGAATWKVRFSPDETGQWRYLTTSSPAGAGLHNRRGEFICTPYQGDNPLYVNGPVGISENRHHFVHANGTPFFWLGETAWNGALLARPGDWNSFLRERREKGFTVMQFVLMQWRSAAGNADGRVGFTGQEDIIVDPVFWQRMDDYVDAVNEHGMVASPVMFWSNPSKTSSYLNPGVFLPAKDLIQLGKYIIARYGAHQVMWTLSGDAVYEGEVTEKWKRVGRTLFGAGAPGQRRPVTMHPTHWCAGQFRDEPWLDFNSYQSGHRGEDERLRFLAGGPVGEEWKIEPVHPQLNMEPNYEDHIDQSPGATSLLTDYHVRRAAYWSLLVTPPAGVSYGANGIWPWLPTPAEAMTHPGTGAGLPWYEAMHLPGSIQMKYMKELMTGLEWWNLRPAPGDVVDQPGDADPALYITVAGATDGSVSLAYIPVGDVFRLRAGSGGKYRWFDPRRGKWSEPASFQRGTTAFTPPDDRDWVLWRSFDN